MDLVLSPGGRRYHAAPLTPDHRDYGVARLALGGVDIPSAKLLDKWCGYVRNQGSEGSCTANATAGDLDFELRRYDPRFAANPASAPTASAQFIYRECRKAMGTQDSDSGSDGRTTCQILQEFGTCTETSWPYVAGDILRDPTPEQLAEATQYRLGAYHFLTNVDDAKHCIASEYPFRWGFAVYESFEEDTGGTTIYQPKRGEALLGYHEVLVKGYDDSKFGGSFSIRNSWGPEWGAGGDFWCPYSVFIDPKVFGDAVIQHRGKPWVAK